MKKAFAFLMAASMSFASLVAAFAAEENNSTINEEHTISPQNINVDTTYAIKSVKPAGTVSDSKEHLMFDGSDYPATRDGETVSAGSSVTYSHTYSGSLQAQLAEKIQLQLGYSFGIDKTFQAYKTSAPLKKGEYCKAYYKKKYNVTKVTQVKYVHTYGYQTINGVSRPVDTLDSTDYVLTCKEAIAPDIRLAYYKARTTRNSNEEDILVAEETYEYVDGEYKLTNKIVY